MKRTQVCLTENQYALLKNNSEKLGISIAELLRRILDTYYKNN